jgi:hypothetical protein
MKTREGASIRRQIRGWRQNGEELQTSLPVKLIELP